MADSERSWLPLVIFALVIWLLIREVGGQARSTIQTVGKTKQQATSGVIDTIAHDAGGIISALGSFFHSGGGAGPGGQSAAVSDDLDLSDSGDEYV